MKTNYISEDQKKKVLKLIKRTISQSAHKLSFGEIMEVIYANDSYLLTPEIKSKVVNLSSGTSQVLAFDKYLKIITKDILNHNYYREYFSPAGSQSVRAGLSIAENARLNEQIYSPGDFCVTEGATGGISSIIEYIAKNYKGAEVLAPVPSYYLFNFASRFHALKFKEVITPDFKKNERFINTGAIVKGITKKTKLIVITQPNNPTGELYTNEELAQIIQIAVKNNILILFDEVFIDLLFNTHNLGTDYLAKQLNALKNIVIVKSFSKDRNLPGFRIGYVYSKNLDLIKYVKKAQENRVFFSTGSNLKSLMLMDSFFRTVSYKSIHETKKEYINKAYDLFRSISYFKSIPLNSLLHDYALYIEHHKKIMRFYGNNYNKISSFLRKENAYVINKFSAFNTFIKFSSLPSINQFDYCLNLYLVEGIKIQLGPYFGFNQKKWEDDSNLGVWMRVTFAFDTKIFIEGFKRLFRFNKMYLTDRKKFLETNQQF